MVSERDTSQEPEEEDRLGSEFGLWRVFDAGRPVLIWKVR